MIHAQLQVQYSKDTRVKASMVKQRYLCSTRAAVLLGATKQSNSYNKNGMRQVKYGEKIVKVHTDGMTDDDCDNESMRQADKQRKMDIPMKGTSSQSQTVQHVTCRRQRRSLHTLT